MNNIMSRYRGWRPWQKTGFWLATLLFLYTLFGFLVAPPIVKAVLEKKLPEVLHRSVAIETLRLNPFALSATVEGFSLAHKEGDGALVAFDRLYANLEILSVFKQALILQSLALENPAVEFSRIDEQTFSFSDLLVAAETPEPEPKSAEPVLFSINNIEIKGGTIRFHDLQMQVNHEVADLQLAIPSISNLPTRVEITVQPQFAAVINGTPLDLGGGSKPFHESLATEFNVKMVGIDIPTYLAYIPNPTGLMIKSALLDLDTRVKYQLFPNQASRLAVTGTVALRDLEIIDDEGTSYLRLPAVTLVLADSNLLNREIRLAELNVAAPQLDLVRRPDGTILPLSLLSPEAAEQPVAAGAEEDVPAPALRLTIDRFRLTGGDVELSDRALANPARLQASEIALAADNLSTIPGTPGSVSLSLLLNRSGRLNGTGSLTLEPLALTSELQLEGLRLKDFQPYASEQARVVLANGRLNLQGNLGFKTSADVGPDLVFSGNSSIDDLATADAVTGADLVKWKAIEFRGIRFGSRPITLAMDEIRLKDPYVQVLIDDDGRANLAMLAKGKEDATAPEPAIDESAPQTSARPQITIGKVVLSNGQIEFQDRNIKPSYGLKLDQLQGSIRGLSSDLEKRASVDISARVDQQAPLTITGTTNPLSAEPFADLKVDFKGFNLPPLSPYTGRYVGYKTGKGKLHLDLEYLIEGSRLESSNRIFLDQFTLGQPVDSPDAISAPVGLAVALLKNRSGEISLDIPVAGDLADPEFSVAGVVVQVIFNLITKAATSPFALLGALIPEGVDIQHIPFEPGGSQATEEIIEKLAVVANVLHERPGLKMEIAGQVDGHRDSEALARSRMLQLVKLGKMKATGAKKKDNSETNISLSEAEYPVYLKQAYMQALKNGSKAQREAASQVKPADAAAERAMMEKFLLETIEIGAEDLRLLAIDRANTVESQLVASGQVEPERLFVVEPQVAAAGEDAGGQAQVELSIR